MSDQWQTSACILCECNCGIKVQTGGEQGREIVRIRGDEDHPPMTCQRSSQVLIQCGQLALAGHEDRSLGLLFLRFLFEHNSARGNLVLNLITVDDNRVMGFRDHVCRFNPSSILFFLFFVI